MRASPFTTIALIAACLLCGWAGRAAESSSVVTVADLLKRYGYAGVDCRTESGSANRMKVDATISNGKKCVLLIDTGCEETILSDTSARGLQTLGQLGVELEDKARGHITNSDMVLMPKISLGQAQFLNQPAKVEKLKVEHVQMTYDGFLGLDFQARNFCLVDVGARRLYFRASALSETDNRTLSAALKKSGFEEIAISPAEVSAVAMQMNSEPVNMVVDTGAEFTTIDESLARRLRLRPESRSTTGSLIERPYRTYMIGVNSIGTHPTWVARLNSIQIGSRKVSGFPVAVTALTAWDPKQEAGMGRKLHGLLGFDFLSTRGAIIDPAGGRLWLRPEAGKKG